MTIDPIHKLHRQFQSVYWDHGRIQTVCLQNTNPNGHTDTVWSPSMIPTLKWAVDGMEGITSFTASIRDQISSDLINYNLLLLDTAIGNKSKNQGVIGNWDKINFPQILITKEKQRRAYKERNEFDDKKWSKKEIANKDINKISFSQRGHAQSTGIRSKWKNNQIFSQKVPTSRFAILRTIQIGAANVCMLWMREREGVMWFDFDLWWRQGIHVNTAENTKTKWKTITEWICNPSCFIFHSAAHSVFGCICWESQ